MTIIDMDEEKVTLNLSRKELKVITDALDIADEPMAQRGDLSRFLRLQLEIETQLKAKKDGNTS